VSRGGRRKDSSGADAPPTVLGLVTAAWRRHYAVRLADGRTIKCLLRGRGLGIACGDRVSVASTADGEGAIHAILPRGTLLFRSDAHREKLLAANVTQVLGIVAHHLKPGMFRQSPTPVSDGAFRRLAQKVDLELLARVAKSDCLGRGPGFDCSAMDWFLERARELGVQHAPPEPLVKGRHLLALGLTPGPRVGEVLKAIYEKQLDGSITTLEQGLELAGVLLRPLR